MEDLSDEDTSSVHDVWTYDHERDLDKAGEETALQALSKMVNNRTHSDLVIVCKNGVRKYGSQLWLSARCAELERRIMSGTITESGLAVISLPNVSPAAMLIILEYLHTGSPGAILQRLEPKTRRIIGADVAIAARQLNLPRMENYIFIMLESEVSRLALAGNSNLEEFGKEGIFEALSRMMKIPRYSDVVIESRDGVLVPASRLWLEARCPALGRMFTGFLAPVQRPREKVSMNVSTEVVYILLQYLYTGSPRTYMQSLEERKRWSRGLEGICAARYLDVPQLENFLWSLLIFDVSRSTSTPSGVELTVFRLSQLRNFPFKFLSGTISEPEEHARNVEIVAMDLVRIIRLAWMDTDCVKHLNRQDFTFLLRKSRRRSYDATGGPVPYKLEEYLRVRSIIKWCVWEQSRMIYVQPEMALKLVSIFFSKAEFTQPLHDPVYSDREREESYRSLYTHRRRIARAKTTRRILKRVCTIAKFEESFLPFVNLELIHPALLINLLKPWGLISSSLIRQALQNRAWNERHLSHYVHFGNRLSRIAPNSLY